MRIVGASTQRTGQAPVVPRCPDINRLEGSARGYVHDCCPGYSSRSSFMNQRVGVGIDSQRKYCLRVGTR